MVPKAGKNRVGPPKGDLYGWRPFADCVVPKLLDLSITGTTVSHFIRWTYHTEDLTTWACFSLRLVDSSRWLSLGDKESQARWGLEGPQNGERPVRVVLEVAPQKEGAPTWCSQTSAEQEWLGMRNERKVPNEYGDGPHWKPKRSNPFPQPACFLSISGT